MEIAYGQILMLLLQCVIIALLLLVLFRLRKAFGLGLLYITLLFFGIGFSQTKPDTLKLQKIEDTKEMFSKSDTLFLKESDSLTLKFNKEATLIDSLWMNDLIKSPLYLYSHYNYIHRIYNFLNLKTVPFSIS